MRAFGSRKAGGFVARACSLHCPVLVSGGGTPAQPLARASFPHLAGPQGQGTQYCDSELGSGTAGGPRVLEKYFFYY